MIGLQRTRILSAAVGVLAEQGYAEFTASAVCGRAGVSRRTFYEVFENREQCFLAILADARQRVAVAIADLSLDRLAWGERIWMGLWALLCLADEDAALARVCLVESQRAGGEIQLERERIIAGLVDVLDEGRTQAVGDSAASRLTAEALVGAVSSVIASRLPQATRGLSHNGRRGNVGVRDLLGELTGMIVLPYEGPAAARRQVKRALPDAPPVAFTDVSAGAPDPLASLPMRLTYRTARVLRAIAQLTETGVGASNRQIAERAEIVDAGQASKLLGRLAQYGLLENAATGGRERGEANQWRLTQTGRRVVRSIGPEAEQSRRRSAA
jgi:AcrR family transcriptional regulator